MDPQTQPGRSARAPNRLIHEKSPYLLQHAYNPVDWRPWGDEAFEAARRADKPVFLSIGYSTCHWCHVMERESFEDSEVAALMNDAFISIKVDREERPDIDNVYMKVCQMVTGSGGWPLTIIMTPERQPFFAATYIPKEDRFGRMGMLELIPRVRQAWLARREDVLNSSQEIVGALQKMTAPSPAIALDESVLSAAFEELSARFDWRYGGFGSAPKFPTPHTLLFLLRYWKHYRDAHALEMAEKTLAAMRRGGIYDHVGFGFHRYSTDAQWLVPHFEKMLYDQALLTLAATEAFQATQEMEYAAIAREIVAYVCRDLAAPEGGFSSAEDADSEGVEGKFYLWKESEIQEVIGAEDADFVIRAFNVMRQGNFAEQGSGGSNGENILHQAKPPDELAREAGISASEFTRRWEDARQKLFNIREKRVRPHKDDKILTDWNGLMIVALARAARVLNEAAYAEKAESAAAFILGRMRTPDGALWHRYRDEEAAADGSVDDYAFMIWAMIELYETTFNAHYLETALDLNARMLQDFWDTQHGGFYFTASASDRVLVRSKEIYDGAVPSGNSVAMLNLLRLSHLTGQMDLEQKAHELGRAFGRVVRESPAAYTQMMIALDFAISSSFEVVVAGRPGADDTRAMLAALRRPFIPNMVVLLRSEESDGGALGRLAPFTQSLASLGGKATAYVCQKFRCQLPTTDVQQMLDNLQVPL